MVTVVLLVPAVGDRPERYEMCDFLIGLLNADETQGDYLASLLDRALKKPAIADTGLRTKLGSTTSDGGSNLKALSDHLSQSVDATSILATARAPIRSSCQPHLLNTVARSINPGKKNENYEVFKYLDTFGAPTVTVSSVLAAFLGGTTLLKKSAPVWRLYSQLVTAAGLKPVMLRNPAATRWLSVVSYLMLLLKYRGPYTALWSHSSLAKKHCKHKVHEQMWLFVEMLVHELMPLFRAIQRMQRDNNDYVLGDAVFDSGILLMLYQRRRLKYLRAGVGQDHGALASLRFHVVNNIANRLKQSHSYFFRYEKDKQHYVFALLLDPRYRSLEILFRVNLFEYDEPSALPGRAANEKLLELGELRHKYKTELLKLATEHLRATTQPASQPEPPRLAKKLSFADLADSQLEVEPEAFPADVLAPNGEVQEVDAKVWAEFRSFTLTAEQELSPLVYWAANRLLLPLLHRLALLFCTVKVSQVTTEGVFSVAGLTSLDRRSSISVPRIDDYCYAHTNGPRPKPKAKRKHADTQDVKKQRIPVPELSSLLDQQHHLAEADLQVAHEENSRLADYDIGIDGYANLTDTLPALFDLSDPLAMPQAVDLDLNDLDLEQEIWGDIDSLLQVDPFTQ